MPSGPLKTAIPRQKDTVFRRLARSEKGVAQRRQGNRRWRNAPAVGTHVGSAVVGRRRDDPRRKCCTYGAFTLVVMANVRCGQRTAKTTIRTRVKMVFIFISAFDDSSTIPPPEQCREKMGSEKSPILIFLTPFFLTFLFEMKNELETRLFGRKTEFLHKKNNTFFRVFPIFWDLLPRKSV